jgi:Na+/H+-dicarboxylate symporter
MDMARTSVNVIGNCLASVVMARWEGVFGQNELQEIAVVPVEETVVPDATLNVSEPVHEVGAVL